MGPCTYYRKNLKDEATADYHLVWKAACDLTKARLGGFYAVYHDHFKTFDDGNEALYYAQFKRFRGLGAIIRHADAKDKPLTTPQFKAIQQSSPSLKEVARLAQPPRIIAGGRGSEQRFI